jgi:hypothetical protein
VHQQPRQEHLHLRHSRTEEGAPQVHHHPRHSRTEEVAAAAEEEEEAQAARQLVQPVGQPHSKPQAAVAAVDLACLALAAQMAAHGLLSRDSTAAAGGTREA